MRQFIQLMHALLLKLFYNWPTAMIQIDQGPHKNTIKHSSAHGFDSNCCNKNEITLLRLCTDEILTYITIKIF